MKKQYTIWTLIFSVKEEKNRNKRKKNEKKNSFKGDIKNKQMSTILEQQKKEEN